MKDRRIKMISTHGYVAANPEFGKPDTGGQVVYILELAKCLARPGYAVVLLSHWLARETDEAGPGRRSASA